MRKLTVPRPVWIISALVILSILAAAALLLTGGKDKKAAESFVKTFYSVTYSPDLKDVADILTQARAASTAENQEELGLALYSSVTGKFGNILTDACKKELLNNRYFLVFETFAKLNKCSIAVTKIKLERESPSSGSGLKYTAYLKITYISGKPEKNIKQTGVVTIVRENGVYKVNSLRLLDYSQLYAMLNS